jgi:hypothetical protein
VSEKASLKSVSDALRVGRLVGRVSAIPALLPTEANAIQRNVDIHPEPTIQVFERLKTLSAQDMSQ